MFPTERGLFLFLYIQTCQIFVLRVKSVSNTEHSAFCNFPGHGVRPWPIQAKSQSVKGGDTQKTQLLSLIVGRTDAKGPELSTTPTIHCLLMESLAVQGPSQSSSMVIPKSG